MSEGSIAPALCSLGREELRFISFHSPQRGQVAKGSGSFAGRGREGVRFIRQQAGRGGLGLADRTSYARSATLLGSPAIL